jgi:small conductance mechanosensitive channel
VKTEILSLWEFHSAAIIELIKDIVVSMVIIVVGIGLSRAIQKLIARADSSRLQVDGTVTSLLRYVVRYGIIIVCVIMILSVFGVNTTSLIAVLGAAGVAVGLALKDTLGNIAAGIILLFLGAYRRGEYIEFGDYSGTVKDINLFTAILETPDGVYISAPNSSIWGTPLKNYSRNGRRRMELAVGIAYSDSLDTAFRVMWAIIAAETRFLKDPEPQVIVQSMQDSSIIIAARAWAPNKDYWNIYWEQMRNLRVKFEEAGLRVPFPRQDVHIIAPGEDNNSDRRPTSIAGNV